MKKSLCRTQFVFTLSILTLCLFQPVLAQSSTEENKIVSKVPLRNSKGAWTKAQVRKWASGPAQDWLDKTAVFFSMLKPQNWDMSGLDSDLFLRGLRTTFDYSRTFEMPSAQNSLDGLLARPYNLVVLLHTLDDLESLSDTLFDVATSGLTRGPSRELINELADHTVVMSELQSEVLLHQIALMNWYQSEVAPPQR